MSIGSSSPPAPHSDAPVFGFILVGGPLSGALIRDVRLANELADRGYAVHVWWTMDRPRKSPLRPSVQEHWLFSGLRYAELPLAPRRARAAREAFGRGLNLVFPDKKRNHYVQKRPHVMKRAMDGLVRHICRGVEDDSAVVDRFARELSAARVTHLLPMLEFLCLWAVAARKRVQHPLKYLMTFQGYELYGNYAREIGLERALYDRFLEALNASDYPAIAVSEDYIERVIEDIGAERTRLCAIPPGVPINTVTDRRAAPEALARKFKDYRPDLPLITFLGRRDTEKGLDLLLYAVAILRRRGLKLQVAICGPTLFGQEYSRVCRQLAVDLRCPVLWSNFVTDELRSALFLGSRCVLYPSIHREPFGMVPVEALAHGTPAIVPDYGGVASAIQANGEAGGLHFRVWDSGNLADQIGRIVEDDVLWQRLSQAGPRVADYYSVRNLADRVLAHLGVAAAPSVSP